MTEANQKPGSALSGYFSEKDLEEIKKAVAEAEEKTSGEIRVKIRLHYEKGLEKNLHAQALKDFDAEGLRNTRDKTGVLILLIMSAQQFRIMGDEGIHQKVPQGYWDVLAIGLTGHFKENNFSLGICEAVREVGRRLAEFFPKKSDDTNELPDDVIVEEEL